ncbi:MAG: hypothetical protein GY729_05470 [Desulfobacteraceae bacterium]|nr:hypothetical protein [Desulfobacteraceae bacterium]
MTDFQKSEIQTTMQLAQRLTALRQDDTPKSPTKKQEPHASFITQPGKGCGPA